MGFINKLGFWDSTAMITYFVNKAELLHINENYRAILSKWTITTKAFPAGNYMFKVNNRNTRTRCEICSKLRIKTPERCHWRRSVVFIVNFEQILHLDLMLSFFFNWKSYFIGISQIFRTFRVTKLWLIAEDYGRLLSLNPGLFPFHCWTFKLSRRNLKNYYRRKS